MTKTTLNLQKECELKRSCSPALIGSVVFSCEGFVFMCLCFELSRPRPDKPCRGIQPTPTVSPNRFWAARLNLQHTTYP